jgi:hypothetical protein
MYAYLKTSAATFSFLKSESYMLIRAENANVHHSINSYAENDFLDAYTNVQVSQIKLILIFRSLTNF